MSPAIDEEVARTTNTFTAVMVKRYGLFAFAQQVLVQNVKHFQERHFRRDVAHLVIHDFAGRVADFIELGELMVDDALHRNESCGGHFREEYQTPEGEALRDDENFAYVAAWQYDGENKPEILNKEELSFENVKLTQRSYK